MSTALYRKRSPGPRGLLCICGGASPTYSKKLARELSEQSLHAQTVCEHAERHTRVVSSLQEIEAQVVDLGNSTFSHLFDDRAGQFAHGSLRGAL